MKRIEIFSPAKINVGLFVVAKRADGFHDIETVFYPIGLRDKMSFDPADEFSFACDDPTIPTGADNLVVKAKDALERETGKRCDVAVRLEKRIPTGGGLGGGSSNAATTLVSLNELCGLGASRETVARLALELGSDVPFFLRPVPSFATGRGEKLKPLDFRIPFPILVVNPKIHVSTAEAYGACVPKKASADLRKICRGEPRDFRKFRKRVTNDFEETVFASRPAIRELKERLEGMGAVFASMSGSGSSVFGVFETLSAAQTARATLPKEYFAYIEDPE